MPTVNADFKAQADVQGKVYREQEVSPPVGGRVTAYSVETTTGCRSRMHKVTLTIVRKDNPADKLEIIQNIKDCTTNSGTVIPPFRVYGGKKYSVTLVCDGFDGGENVEGKASATYVLFVDMDESSWRRSVNS